MDEKIRVELARPAPAGVSFPLALDNSLVEAYNEEHGTSYEAIDPARVSLGTLSVAAGDFKSDEVSVTVSSANIEKGYYLVPIVVELPQGDVYTSKEKLVRYLLVTVASMDIDVRRNGAYGRQDRAGFRLDDRLLPGYQLERCQRRLEPRFRCAESPHVRR